MKEREKELNKLGVLVDVVTGVLRIGEIEPA